MKIRVVQREFQTDEDTSVSYKLADYQYCCDGIKKIPNLNLYYQYTENYGEDSILGLMLVNSVTYHDPWDYDSYGYTQEYYYKLDYCPCCGSKIDIDIVDNVDVSKEYKDMCDERKKLHQKYLQSDSIKKRDEYEKMRYDLDQKISTFYYTDQLPEKNKDA